MSPTAEMRPRISTWAQKHSQPFSIWNDELSAKMWLTRQKTAMQTPAQSTSQYEHRKNQCLQGNSHHDEQSGICHDCHQSKLMALKPADSGPGG